jgi:hypothetical protein
MLKHARAGVPMEVMGLMLGEFVDEYTITVVDVFAMPQSGTGVSVEAVDDVFQQQMMEYPSFAAIWLTQVSEINRSSRNGCRMVPLSSRIRMLALICRYPNPTSIRKLDGPCSRSRRRPNSIRKGKSRH